MASKWSQLPHLALKIEIGVWSEALVLWISTLANAHHSPDDLIIIWTLILIQVQQTLTLHFCSGDNSSSKSKSVILSSNCNISHKDNRKQNVRAREKEILTGSWRTGLVSSTAGLKAGFWDLTVFSLCWGKLAGDSVDFPIEFREDQFDREFQIVETLDTWQ